MLSVLWDKLNKVYVKFVMPLSKCNESIPCVQYAISNSWSIVLTRFILVLLNRSTFDLRVEEFQGGVSMSYKWSVNKYDSYL